MRLVCNEFSTKPLMQILLSPNVQKRSTPNLSLKYRILPNGYFTHYCITSFHVILYFHILSSYLYLLIYHYIINSHITITLLHLYENHETKASVSPVRKPLYFLLFLHMVTFSDIGISTAQAYHRPSLACVSRGPKHRPFSIVWVSVPLWAFSSRSASVGPQGFSHSFPVLLGYFFFHLSFFNACLAYRCSSPFHSLFHIPFVFSDILSIH